MLGLDQLAVVKDLPSPDGEWEVIQHIGEGNYGEVYKARGVKNGELAAVKVMEVSLDKEEDIKAELNVFQNHAHHPNIVNFYGAYVKRNNLVGDHLWLVMEYCSYGSVTDLAKLMKEKSEKMPEDIIAYVLREVLAGLSYLHSSCVLHRDVKGQNVLLTKTAKVKLIDFGVSAVLDGPSGKRRTAIGTPYWMAPEVIACESQLDCDYDARSDVWSLGITAIEIADSTPPLFGEHPMRALFKIPKHSPPTLQSPSLWSKSFNNFIHVCLMKDFEKRPTAKELLNHNFVSCVPRDPRPIRRKLVSLFESQQPEDVAPLTDSSSSTCGKDTIQRTVRALRTLDTVSDLASLEYINEHVIVSQLWKRYQKQQIYTYVGDILISINPFQKLSIYGDKYSHLYCRVPRSHLPPHIFAVANSAYQSMLHEGRDQCCVVSGESGAGKTEASNILVQQFMKLGQAETRTLEEKILKINPLMESFGNARTVINNNSSRFGKYLELHFTGEGRVMGAHVYEYLLEKSRVISQARRERNFHIFYYMLAGLSSRRQLGKYRLKSGQHHRYLEHRGTHKGNMKQDALYSERFDQIEQAFYLFGFTKAEFSCILSILAAILNIGDIRIEGEAHPHVGEVSVITNPNKINDVAHLLQIRPEPFHRAITTSQVITYGEVIIKPNSTEKALDARDAIAKTLYGRLFSWIVNRINPALNSPEGSSGEQHIGILDIFGFENFRKNSFEQLCINVANEQLQFYFNQHVFAWEQEEYEREGINVTQVGYRDNLPLLDILLSRPMGLLSLLDEESKFPRSTDHSLATKFHCNYESSAYYSRPKDGGPTFTIHHYAGSVTYETAKFLEKNRDTLKSDMSKTLQKSANEVIQALFVTPLSRTGSLSAGTAGGVVSHKAPPSATPLFNRRAPHYQRSSARHGHGHTPLSSSNTITAKLSQTVSTYFINSLRDLMSKMLLAKPHFVRCIRPNEMKSPDLFQPDKVLLQLRYTGVLETTRIRKEGFSHRISFEDFIRRYKVICFPLTQPTPGTAANCLLILEKAGLENWALGKTKVFLKYYHSESLLNLLASFDSHATVLQSLVRGWMGRRRAKERRRERKARAAVKIQAVIRRYLERCRYLRLVARRQDAAVVIQTAFRGWMLRSKYLAMLQERQVAAIKIQRAVRGWLCLNKYQTLRRSAVKIQRCIRQWLAGKALKRALQKMKQEAEEKKKKAALRKRKQSLRWHLQQHAQASVQKMAVEQRVPSEEDISAVIIQRAFRKSVARRKKKAKIIAANWKEAEEGPAETHLAVQEDKEEKDSSATSPKSISDEAVPPSQVRKSPKSKVQWSGGAMLPSQVRKSQLHNQQVNFYSRIRSERSRPAWMLSQQEEETDSAVREEEPDVLVNTETSNQATQHVAIQHARQPIASLHGEPVKRVKIRPATVPVNTELDSPVHNVMTQQMWQANTEPVSGARCVATQHTPQGAVSPALRHVAMQHTPQHTASVAVSIPHIQQHIALGKNQHTQQPPAPVSMQASPPPPPSSNRIHNVSTDKERSVHPTNASSIRRLFEEMSRCATEGQRGGGVKFIGHQRVKARRLKNRPDSVIQRLLERFDPAKLNHSGPITAVN